MPPTTSNQFHHATSLRKVKSTPSKTAIPFLLFLCATTALAFPHTTEADSYTKLLIHADGADGSTTFTDSSPFHHAVTVTGSAEVDTAQSNSAELRFCSMATGVSAGSPAFSTNSASAASTNAVIGGRDSGTDRQFDGYIDDVRVYNRALSPTEVKQLYKLGTVIIRP